MIAGSHSAGRDGDEGVHTVARGSGTVAGAGVGADGAGAITQFWHSPRSWAALWDGGVFPRGTVRVEAALVDRAPERMRLSALMGVDLQKERLAEGGMMKWSVTRV